MTEINTFSKLSLDSPNKYILYLSGICFILSLILPFEGINNEVIRNGAMTFIIIGIINWIFSNIKGRVFDYYELKMKDYEDIPRDIEEATKGWEIVQYFILIVSYLIGLGIIFNK